MYNKNLVFAAACLGMFLFGVVLISLGSILPSVIETFKIDEIAAGSLATLLPLGILFGSVVFGPIVDKYGYKSLFIFCAFLVFLGLEMVAFATAFYVLQISVFIIGFGGGVLNGGTNALVSDISEENKGAKLSLLGVFFGIGALGMPSILGLLTGVYSYQTVISIIALFVLIPIVFFITVKFPKPKQSQGMPIKNGLGLVKESTILLFGFTLFFQSGLEGLINNWTTTYLTYQIDIQPKYALYALTFFVIGMTVARIFLGIVLQKFSSSKILFILLSISLVASAVMYFAASFEMSIVALLLFGIGLSATFPVLLGYVGELYASLSGTAFSVVLVIALLGNMILNYLMGLISQLFGIEYFVIIVFVSIIVLIIMLKITLNKILHKIKI